MKPKMQPQIQIQQVQTQQVQPRENAPPRGARLRSGKVEEEIQDFLQAVNSYAARVAKEPRVSFQQHLTSIFAGRNDSDRGEDDRHDRNPRRH